MRPASSMRRAARLNPLRLITIESASSLMRIRLPGASLSCSRASYQVSEMPRRSVSSRSRTSITAVCASTKARQAPSLGSLAIPPATSGEYYEHMIARAIIGCYVGAMAILHGIHHVTAITGDAQRNVDFYVGLLGLRLVKKTVNFDDPTSYHLYYGDELGRPGSAMTFFVWPGAPRGRQGPGQVIATAFSVPAGSLGWWADRLREASADVGESGTRFGDDVLPFADPEGMRL